MCRAKSATMQKLCPPSPDRDGRKQSKMTKEMTGPYSRPFSIAWRNESQKKTKDFCLQLPSFADFFFQLLQNHSAEWNMSTRSSIVWYSISGLTCSQLAPVNFYGLAGSISCSNIGPFNHQMSRKKSKCFWDIWHIRFLGGGNQSYYYNFGGFRGHKE